MIVSYNSALDLRGCVQPWLDAGVSPGRIVVIDNASADESPAIAASLGCRLVDNHVNRGFAAAANQGIRIACESLGSGGWIGVINPDTAAVSTLEPFLTELAGVGDDVNLVIPVIDGGGTNRTNVHPYPSLRVVGAWLWNRDSMTRPRAPVASLAHNYAIGSVLLMRAQAWLSAGLFDERFFLYGEDAALSAECRDRSFKWVTLQIPLRHAGNAPLLAIPNRQRRLMIEGLVLFLRLHGSGLDRVLAPALLAFGCTERAFLALVGRRWSEARVYARVARYSVVAGGTRTAKLQRDR